MTETTPDPTTYKGTVLKILAKADEPIPPRKIKARMEDKPQAGIGTQLSALVEEDRVERVSDIDKYGSAYRATDKGEADINVEQTPDTSSPTEAGGLSGLFDDMEDDGKSKVSETSDEDPRNGTNDDDKTGEGIDKDEHTADDPTMSDDAHGPVEELVDPKVAAFAESFADADNVLAVSDEGLTDLIHAVATTDDLARAKRRALIAALSDAKKPASTLPNAIREVVMGNESDIRRVPVPKVVRDMEE